MDRCEQAKSNHLNPIELDWKATVWGNGECHLTTLHSPQIYPAAESTRLHGPMDDTAQTAVLLEGDTKVITSLERSA